MPSKTIPQKTGYEVNSQPARNPIVSIIVPIFNRAHLVEPSIGSLCLQDFGDLEIIVVDDASTDDLVAALDALGDARIRLVRRGVNGGAAAARNDGVAAARGDLIAFSDSDDICIFNRIGRQVAALSTAPELIGVYSSRLFHTELEEAEYGAMRSHVRPWPHERPLSGELFAATLRNNVINLPTLMVRRSALERAGPFDPLLRNNEDWDHSLRLTRQGPIGFIPDPLLITPSPVTLATEQGRISKSKRASARSFVRITGKLRRDGHEGPVLADHYRTTARLLIREGRVRSARGFMRRALWLRPVFPKLWLQFALSAFPETYTRLRGWYRARQ